MPSPIGHALAGAIVAVARSPRDASISVPLVVTCGVLACAPDLDLLVWPTHRTATHSLAAVLVVFIAVIALRRRHDDRLPTALTCAAAYASHLVLDLVGVDVGRPAGLQLFWPFVNVWYQSPWPLFLAAERRTPFEVEVMLSNLKTLVWESLVLVPALVTLLRRRRLRAPYVLPPATARNGSRSSTEDMAERNRWNGR